MRQERSPAVKKNIQRWIPAAVVPAVIITAAVAVPAVANAAPSLPEKSAQQLLELVAGSRGTPFSGTIEQTSALGLPDVSALSPAGGGDSASSALELLSGSHTANVFVGGPTTQRVQLLEGFAERDAIRNGDSVWLYDSDAKEATHVTASAPTDLPAGPTLTPGEAAEKLLAAVDQSTEIEVVDTVRVAGRAAYELRLTPDDADTLVGSVVLSVDAETGLPLAVEVTADGQKSPAFSVRFSRIDFDAPAASVFDFAPPSDVTVEEQTLDSTDFAAKAPDAAATDHPRPTLVGEGWDAVVVLPAGALPANTTALDQLTAKVDGGRVLTTSLVSVLLTDDGRVLVGAVTPQHLQDVAAQ
jgi:outer membrane lipoprotein-sorting protein